MKYLKMLGLAAVAAMAVMAVVGASVASATTLEVAGAKQNKAVSIVATLATGSTATLVDEGGSTTDTCTASEVKGSTEGTFTTAGSAAIGGAVGTLSFGSCSHTTKVLKNGKLSVDWIKGTTNGTVTSSEAEVTVVSTIFGISAVCKTGAGTDVGTLTGVASGNATMHIDATKALDCGAFLGKATWTGTYTVTSPSGLGVVE
jgi:type II secretory pathway pseudopilin PulG